MDDEKCTSCAEKGKTCMPFFVHENAMMHKDMDNERLNETMKEISNNNRKTVLTVCAAFVLIIIIFVTAYTVRTSIWLDTITRMNQTITELAKGYESPEVDHDVHQQPDH